MPKAAILPAAAAVAETSVVPWAAILLGIWVLGFAVEAGRLALAAAGLRRWTRHSISLGHVGGVDLRALAGLSGPVASGVLRPVIFVPSDWQALPEDSRRVVLEHELAHHRRRDPLWRLLAGIACAIHWYHPLVRWMARRLVMQCEFACDAVVLRRGIDAKTYARVLCDFSGESSSRLALPMAETSSLETRVRRMLAPAGRGGTSRIFILSGFGFMAALGLAALEREAELPSSIPASEVQLRLTANPFPGEP